MLKRNDTKVHVLPSLEHIVVKSLDILECSDLRKYIKVKII